MLQIENRQRERILSYLDLYSIQALNRFHEAHPYWGRQSCFAQPTDLNVDPMEKPPHRHTEKCLIYYVSTLLPC